MTANVYTHVPAPELREAIRRMDALMGAPSEDDDPTWPGSRPKPHYREPIDSPLQEAYLERHGPV